MIVTTWSIADTTTVTGLRALFRPLDSKNEVSSMFDLLLKSPGRSKLAGCKHIDTDGRAIVPQKLGIRLGNRCGNCSYPADDPIIRSDLRSRDPVSDQPAISLLLSEY